MCSWIALFTNSMIQYICCQFSYIVCFSYIASEKLSKEVERRKVVTEINKRLREL